VSFQIGIDVGGTFTDLVISRPNGLHLGKTLTTPGDEAKGILNGLADAATAHNITLQEMLSQTEVVVLGTTTVTNALLEYRGVKTGLIVTEGFRDMLELRRNYRESLFDIRLKAPHAIVPRHLRLGVPERVDHRGNVVTTLDEAAAREAARKLHELKVESIAVCFLFSFVNSAHELRMREILAEECPGIPVSLSFEILPQVREFERLSTTVVNAYVQPLAARGLDALSQKLKDSGFKGELFVMQSNGGMTHVEFSRRHPVELVLSGPAGGVVAGARISAMSGYRNVITVDMGGTSYDVCLVQDGEPASGTDAWISRYRIATPMVDIHTIGAGGGSIAWIDDGGALRVGPRSAGAQPGPACYGRGGVEPTVTDADVVLGYVSPDSFRAGNMKLSAEAARTAIETYIAKPLGMDVIEAASGIFRIANNAMANAVRHVTVSRGHDPADFALCVFGGAGAIHAGPQAIDLGIRTILVPKAASVLSALGNQMSDFKVTKVQSFIRRVQDLVADDLNDAFTTLLQGAEADLGAQDKVSETIIRRFIGMRYRGQTQEVQVPVRARTRRVTELNMKAAIDEFHTIHEQLYSFKQPVSPVEVLDLRLDLIGVRAGQKMQSEAFGTEDPAVALRTRRPVYFHDQGGFVDTPVYDGTLVTPGQLIQGPAIIEEPTTTIVVHPGQEAMADQYRTYVIEVQV
jgi:N-methylhydantoinase A